MLSKSCEYAIRAMIFISQKVGDVPKASVKEIATNINAPIHFIAKILQELCKKKILQSIKGPNGGFYLEK
ncbi:MAG: Rrf2 family transcriptional regulator, partial [Ferruginibacter sp.]